MRNDFQIAKDTLEEIVSSIVFRVSLLKENEERKNEVFKSIGLRRQLVQKILNKKKNGIKDVLTKSKFSETDIESFRGKILEAVKTTLIVMLNAATNNIPNAFFVKGADVYYLSKVKDLPTKLGVSSKMIETGFLNITNEAEELFSVDYYEQSTMFADSIFKSKEGLFLHSKEEMYWGGGANQLFLISEATAAETISKLKTKKKN